jgi:hypothetical protein
MLPKARQISRQLLPQLGEEKTPQSGDAFGICSFYNEYENIGPGKLMDIGIRAFSLEVRYGNSLASSR